MKLTSAVCISPEITPDFELDHEGKIFLLRPLTPAAHSWVGTNLSEDHLSFGDSVVVEHRYIIDIVAGILEDGLRFQ
jgi:hypothetical protein